MDNQGIIDCTRRWIAEVVIELNLCPFAWPIFLADQIRYVVTLAQNEKSLLHDLTTELVALAAVPSTRIETTLLIHPAVLEDFFAYNNFLDKAEQQVEDLGLRGILQIVSFHPDYQFADTPADAVENFTNRSPFPMLQLLREESIAMVTGDLNEVLEIPKRNIATLRALGREKILAKLKALGVEKTTAEARDS